MNNLEKGQEILVQDLEELLTEAKAGEFGDFSNEKYDAPKMVLKARLSTMAQAVVDGKYD